MRTPLALPFALASLTLGACTHVQTVQGLDERLTEAPGGYVTGQIATIERAALLDNKEFVYAIDLSPTGDEVAFTRLAGKEFNVGIWKVGGEGPTKLADFASNGYEFDVEGLDFSPDGKTIVTAGRDGAVRFYSAADGKKIGEFFAEEPLTSVLYLPDGRHVVAGSARGLLIVLTADGRYASELRAHADEVRGLAVTPDGRVVSGSWDKSIAVFRPGEAPISVDVIRLSVGLTPEKVSVVRVGVDGRTGIFAFDASRPEVILSSELARAAGIQEKLLTETTTIGAHQARIARGQSMQLKQLEVKGVDVAICDACVPKGTAGVLGAALLGRFEVQVDPVTGELVLTAKEKVDPESLPTALALTEVKRHRFESFVNDLSIDRAGRRLGVAFSNEKAERNRKVYEREKRGEPAPFSVNDYAAIVDVESGKVHRKWRKHVGVVSTVGISPDGRSVVTGGWDNWMYVFSEDDTRPKAQEKFGWSVRRARFSRDGRRIAVGAWTPPNAVGNQESDPSAVVYTVGYATAEIQTPLSAQR